MATSAPTTRSDIRSLRDEKKKREEEQRRKAEEKKANEGKRRPSIGYPEDRGGKGPQAPFSMEKARAGDNSRRVNSQMDRMVGTVRAEEGRDRVNSQMNRMVNVARDETARDEQIRGYGKSLTPAIKQGISLLGQLATPPAQSELLGTAGLVRTGRLEELRNASPEMSKPDARTPGQRVDAQGKFADEGDISRREKARELEGDLESSREQYRPSYDKYRERAAALGIDPEDMMSLDEFAQDMMGVQPGADGMGLEQVAPGVSPSSASSNLQTPRLNLDGEVNMPSNQGDKDNAGRVRDIVSERKKRDPDAPLSAGLQAQIKSTQVDPYTGLPMTEGSGKLVVPSINKDGSVEAKTYTRGIPREIQDAAAELPAAERDMYIAQSMGVDLSKYPPSQRQAAAQAFVREKEGLAERGNMVEAYTDPETGYFVDAKGNQILDENGKPRKSDVPLAYDEDGNLLSGSQAPVFIRSEAALKRGKQRKKYNSVMQRAESIAGNKSVSQFLTVDPDTGRESLDVAAFEERFPGSLPPEGDPQRADAIEKLTSMAMRGKAVKQNNDRLGRAQQYASPTFGPMLMMESLQQAETPEEKIAIANYFNRPDLVALYQEQAMGDRGILKAEKEAEAAAAMRGGGDKTEINMNAPSEVSGNVRKTITDGINDNNLNSARIALTTGESPMMSEEQFNMTALQMDAVKQGPDGQSENPAALLKPMHRPFLAGLFEGQIKDSWWKDMGSWTDEQREAAVSKFTTDVLTSSGLSGTEDTKKMIRGIFEQLYLDRFGTPMPRPKRNTETKGVGLPDDEVESGTVPPPGPAPQASARP